MIYYLDLIGTLVFAITGCLAAGNYKRAEDDPSIEANRPHGIDLFGAVVLGVVTAIGGGTLRDVILDDSPVFWVADPNYLRIAVVGSVVTFFWVRYLHVPRRALIVADAIGLAVFTAIGVEKTLSLDKPIEVAILMGMMTGAAGGIIRDVLTDRVPLILRREIYATASLAGAIVFIILTLMLPYPQIALTASILCVLTLRLLAVRYRVELPTFRQRERKKYRR